MTQEIELLVHFRILILFILISGLLFSQTHPDIKVDRALKTGISEIVKQNYRGAEKIFQELDKDYPQIPLGKIYIAATLIAESYDYDSQFDDKRISELLNEAKKTSEILLSANKQSIWNKYYLALIFGYQAYYEAIKGNLIKALSVGLNSYNLFDEILEQDSTFQDALIAVGTYKYWKSDKLEFLSWLPFIDDEREVGIKFLERSIRNNSYNSHLAIYSLIWIFIHQKNFNNAKELAEYALDKFPQSRIFKESLARIYEEIDLNKSVQIYNQVLDSYEKLELENRVRIITLKHKIAIQLQKAGKKAQALKICDEILSIQDLSEYETEKLSSRIDRIKKMQSELRK